MATTIFMKNTIPEAQRAGAPLSNNSRFGAVKSDDARFAGPKSEKPRPGFLVLLPFRCWLS
jgi:hypothetical protein